MNRRSLAAAKDKRFNRASLIVVGSVWGSSVDLRSQRAAPHTQYQARRSSYEVRRATTEYSVFSYVDDAQRISVDGPSATDVGADNQA